MIELLQKIFIGHRHKWEVKETVVVTNEDKTGNHSLIKVLQCGVCGNLKNHHIRAQIRWN